MTDALHGADPDAVAECPRCGARVRVAMVGRHDRDHQWDDELERRVDALEKAGVGRLVDWPGDDGDGIEPDPELAPDDSSFETAGDVVDVQPAGDAAAHRFG